MPEAHDAATPATSLELTPPGQRCIDPCEQAMAAAHAGDGEAFSTIVRTWATAMRTWVAARCPPEIDADDVVQASFVIAYEQRGIYAPGTDLRAWLWTIVRNQLRAAVTDALRRRQRRQQHFPELVRHELLRRIDDASDADDADIAALQTCIAHLSTSARGLLQRHYTDRVPLPAIAQADGRSLPAIKKALFVIRRGLLACIEHRRRHG